MNKKTERILLFLIFVFCISIRLTFITQKNLWFDEVFSWNLSIDSFYEIIVRTSNDIHPPLYYFILKIWNFLIGDSVFSMRFLSALFTSSAVFLLYPLARKILSPVNSFIVLILYSVSPLNLYYSQEVRMAAMNLFLNLGSVYFLTILISRDLKIKELIKNKIFYFYVFFTASALYTHYFSFFILTAEITYIIFLNRLSLKKYKKYIAVYLFIFAIYSAWVQVFLEQLKRGQSWRNPQSLPDIAREYLNYLKDMNLGLYYHYTDLTLVRYIIIIIAVIMLISFAGLFFRKKNETWGNSITYIFLLTFVPLILAGIISVKQKVEFYRYLSILVPYILILLVYGLSRWNRKLITYSLLAVFALVNVYGIYIHFSFNFKNDDYRGLVKEIELNYVNGERIYTEPHYYGWIIDYYKKQNDLKIPNTAFIRYGWNELIDSLSVQKPAGFWVVIDYSAVDTSKYAENVTDLEQKYEKDFNMTYYLAPERVELYRFKKKVISSPNFH